MMHWSITTFWVLGSLLSVRVSCAVPYGQVNAPVDYGTFQNPSKEVRPGFRYWLPDASADHKVVAREIKRARALGAGVLEILGFYFYGGAFQVDVKVDWTKYGWGLPAWKKLQDAALQAADENDMFLDFTIGPNQGAGVPAKPDDEGLMWDLKPFNVSVPIGHTYNDILPGWGTGPLVSASVGLVTNSTKFKIAHGIFTTYYNGKKDTLALSTLQDVTSQVGENGHLKHHFPQNPRGIEYRIFAYYLKHSGYRECISPTEIRSNQSPVTNYVQNGSFVVDHFSSRGAQTTIDFWERHLLDKKNRAMLKRVGNYMWEDSQEYGAGATIWWTPKLLPRFKSARKYELQKFLPLLFDFNNAIFGPVASKVYYVTDETDEGQSYVSDYRQTLTELNEDYLNTLRAWSERTIGHGFSAQVVYNEQMDMLANVPLVNAPEVESLGFSDLVDGYRQYSGPANLAGRRVISTEVGAAFQSAYQQFIPSLLESVKRSVAGSINRMMFHGMVYAGSYPTCTWPGFVTFADLFSEMHSRHLPGFDFYSDFMEYVSRLQFVAQTGIPKMDLAIWLKSDDWPTITSKYEPNDLTSAGFSYEYLSPDNLALLPNAYVKHKALAPKRQSFQALIVRGNDSLTVAGAEKLVEYAHDGLPIIFSGGVPKKLFGFNTTGEAYVKSALKSIEYLKNVHQVPYIGLASSLARLNIVPRTQIRASSTWYTYWREDAKSSINYVYVYNDGAHSRGSITFATSGNPYVYDAWTGKVYPIAVFSRKADSIKIPFRLARKQTTIIAFKMGERLTASGIASVPKGVESNLLSNDRESAILKVSNAASNGKITLPNGKKVRLPKVSEKPFMLSNWRLIVESWAAPNDLSDQTSLGNIMNTTYNLDKLKSWNKINTTLENVSGRGYYSTSFSWSPAKSQKSGSANGAIIDFGSIIHTIRVSINGHMLAPLDITAAKADIGPYLKKGKNKIEAVVSTPLGNALRPVWYRIGCAGFPASGSIPTVAEYGLIHEVVVTPYRTATFSLS